MFHYVFALILGCILIASWPDARDPNLRPSFAQLCVALKPLQRLVVSSHVEQPTASLAQEIPVNSTP